MWLAYATGFLEHEGHSCRLIDAPALGCELQPLLEEHINGFIPDLIICDTSTPSISNDVKVAGYLKDHFGGPFTVLVGTHPSALPEDVLKMDDRIDAVFRQEYEYPAAELAERLENAPAVPDLQGINGLSYRHNGQIIHNSPAELPTNLDNIPFVSEVYHKHLNYKDYFYSHSKYPIVTIVSSRGCPHHCIYCVYPQVFSSHKVRYRNVSNVVDEIEYILEHFPDVKEIMFEDDTFTLNKKRCRQFANEVLGRGINFTFSANARADVDYETMCILKEAGARLFCVGIESGSQEILDNMRKGLKVDRIKQFFKDAKKAGILVHGCFMVGNPGETRKTLQTTLEFAKELEPDTAQFFPIMVYPGTEAYEWARGNGFLKTVDFDSWLDKRGMHNTLVSRPGLSAEDLVEFCDRARKEFYLRPSYVCRKFLQGLTDPSELKRLSKGASHLFKSMLAGDRGDDNCSNSH
jgi:radical SAM superfamily enzyme YgiQ (UPF0313 family)